MIVTAAMLREWGAKNVVTLPNVASIVNSGVTSAKSFVYSSEEELKESGWFIDAVGGGMLLMYESPQMSDIKGSLVVRLFDFSNWSSEWGNYSFKS
jgi:hypothetical protein